MKKGLIRIVWLILIALAFIPTVSFADDTGETIGDLTWKLVDEKLTISGEGTMDGYSSKAETPWYSEIENIKTIEIEEGVTSIGNHAFSGCSSLT
ncbi:MAG: hypothetical protein HUJ78_05480, partial [Mogibacterium sp.]|nr:hypothetical protein [Mogibacterium sp.]